MVFIQKKFPLSLGMHINEDTNMFELQLYSIQLD
jgi:hypothetical protein